MTQVLIPTMADSSLSESASDVELVRLAVDAMGARFELLLAGADEILLRAAGEQAIEEILFWDRTLSRFRSDSLITCINRSAVSAQPVKVDDLTFGLLSCCQRMWKDTSGAFDITVGALMDQRFRFHHQTDDGQELTPQPSARQAVVGGEYLELDANRRTALIRHPQVRLDLGAVGKGFALDRVRSILLENNIPHALVHGGTSSIITIGSRPDGEPWVIALRRPPARMQINHDESTDDWVSSSGNRLENIIGTVMMNDGDCLAVSAPHGRIVNRADEAVDDTDSAGFSATASTHIIDPRDGSSGSVGGLTAVLANAGEDDSESEDESFASTRADSWSTAIMVLMGQRPRSMPADLTSIMIHPPREIGAEGDETLPLFAGKWPGPAASEMPGTARPRTLWRVQGPLAHRFCYAGRSTIAPSILQPGMFENHRR